MNVHGLHVALICDNPFARFIQIGLTRAGASVELFESIDAMSGGVRRDVVVIALDPCRRPALGDADFRGLSILAPSARIAQFWGDIDRDARRGGDSARSGHRSSRGEVIWASC